MNEDIPKRDEEMEDRPVNANWGAPIFWLVVFAAACMAVVSICTIFMWMLVAWRALQ